MSGPKVSAAELKRMKRTEEEKRRLFQSLIREKEKRKRCLDDISTLSILAASVTGIPKVTEELDKLGKMKRENAESLARIDAALQSRSTENMAEMLQNVMAKHDKDEQILSETSDYLHEVCETYMEQKMKAFAKEAEGSASEVDKEKADSSAALLALAGEEAKRLTALLDKLIERAEAADIPTNEAKKTAEEIKRIAGEEGRDGLSVFNDIHRLDLYKVRPFGKEVGRKEKELDELDEKLSEELAVYHSLCREAGVAPKKFAFAESSVQEIRYECGKMIADRDDDYEVRSLMKTVRESLTELGYVYLGKKEEEMNFYREIYRFDENAVLHVIYDSEGKVTMEVAAADNTDREPHPREVDTIVKEQEKFCDAYESVFERINEKGVSFRKEMMCPCGPEFAQVINVSEFEKSADEEAQTFDEMYADRKTKYLYVSR